MADLVKLVPSVDSPTGFRAACNEDTIERLRDLLDRADRGEIVGCVVCFVQADGSYGHNWSRTDNTAGMLAAVTLAQAAYAQHLLEHSEEKA